MKQKSAGFTLIELVVAVLITAILSRIGFDVYKRYIMRANRTVAKTALASLSAKQETQALQNPLTGYATNFAALNGLTAGTTSFYIDQSGAVVSAASASIYQISFAASPTPSGTAYAFQAVAQGVQAAREARGNPDCTTLILYSTGLKQAQNSSGTAVDASSCWDK